MEVLMEFYLPLKYHTNLHHSQTEFCRVIMLSQLKYHTNLHHSQTAGRSGTAKRRLSTILIYIILKRLCAAVRRAFRLSTILIYIILKLPEAVVHGVLGLSTILIYIILKPQTSNHNSR